MSEQLTLSIRLRDDATFENYFAGQNEQVVHNLETQEEPYVFLFGASGTGKSHLLQAACHEIGQKDLPVVYLPLAEDGLMPAMLDDLENMSLIALDDIQIVIGNEDWELALFNLYNRVREKGVNMLVSSTEPLASLNIKLADLKSRLSWGPIFQLSGLSDKEKQFALQQRAKNRGLDLADEVVMYLLKRSPRDMNSLFSLFEKLDKASMVEKRKLTIPFIKDYL
jgi:DnaA family protein